ncbi:Glycine betaine/proline betaine transport system ATP-binding protein ProV [compost metagenome]
MSQPVLEVRNIFKVFGENPSLINRAIKLAEDGVSKEEILEKTGCTVGVNNVSLQINKAEIYVIMGLSGSGKSTLVRHFNRLIEPTAGEILIHGRNIVNLPEKELQEVRRKQISMVFQSFALLPHKTVIENIAFGLLVRGESVKESELKALKWVNGKLGLKGYGDKYPDELSGGMRQRVGLARALIAETDVVLLDEAFSALDPLIRSEMQDILLEIQKEMHKTLIFITHDLDEAIKIGSRIAIMKDGRVVQEGTPDQILNNPADDYVKKFVEKRVA